MVAVGFELLDRRALALLTFVDALGAEVVAPVSVVGAGVRSFAKRPGAVVITAAPGFKDYAAAFDPLPAVAAASVPLDLRPHDPALAPRRIALALPRDPDPDPARTKLPGSLFQPVEITLLPTPLSELRGLTAAFSVSVRRATDNARVEGALVRLRPEGGRPEARALTDAAGEALLLVPGVPLASPGAGAVVRPDIGADLDAVVDPALARFHADADLGPARDAARQRNEGFIDPDDLAARLGAAATPAQAVRIEAGRTRTAAIMWTP